MHLRTILALLIVFTLASAVLAQTKYSGTWHCPKADPVYTVPVGDRPDHVFRIGKSSGCTLASPVEIGGIALKDEESTFFGEQTGNRARGRSLIVGTAANGDKYDVRSEFSITYKGDTILSGEGTWTLTGRTGKLKGVKAKGTSNGKYNPDGSATWDFEGEYQLPR